MKSSGGNESDVEDALDDRKKGGGEDGDSEEEVVGKPRRKVRPLSLFFPFADLFCVEGEERM